MASIKKWMNETISVRSPSGTPYDTGTPRYSAVTTYKARIERGKSLSRQTAGEDVSVIASLACEDEIKYDDLIWFPEDTVDSTPPKIPVKIQTAYDKNNRYSFYEVELGHGGR